MKKFYLLLFFLLFAGYKLQAENQKLVREKLSNLSLINNYHGNEGAHIKK